MCVSLHIDVYELAGARQRCISHGSQGRLHMYTCIRVCGVVNIDMYELASTWRLCIPYRLQSLLDIFVVYLL